MYCCSLCPAPAQLHNSTDTANSSHPVLAAPVSAEKGKGKSKQVQDDAMDNDDDDDDDDDDEDDEDEEEEGDDDDMEEVSRPFDALYAVQP